MLTQLFFSADKLISFITSLDDKGLGNLFFIFMERKLKRLVFSINLLSIENL